MSDQSSTFPPMTQGDSTHQQEIDSIGEYGRPAPGTMMRGSHWLNPPHAYRPDDEPAIVQLHPAELRVLRELVAAELAGDTEPYASTDPAARDRYRNLSFLDATLEWCNVTEADADRQGLSRQATWHPANQLSRMMPTVLAELARWGGGEFLVYNAVDYAAAIEADRKEWTGVRNVAAAAIYAGRRATDSGYGRVLPPAEEPKPDPLAIRDAHEFARALTDHEPCYDYDGCQCGDESVQGAEKWRQHVIAMAIAPGPDTQPPAEG